ncbi:MAG: M4 family metallopeptidase [Lachnospiraceae bacterium]|nr:M4 family metallopeptidase [Lachnospiraceae bacterium]
MAHEFTHALTGAVMTTNLYMNDYGAINEAMSDIFGNLVESLMGKTEDTTWLIQENGNQPIRCMSDPHGRFACTYKFRVWKAEIFVQLHS